MRIKFTQDYVVDDHRKGTDAEEIYRSGKTYVVNSEASAIHFVRRGVAVAVDKAAKQAAGGVEVAPKPVEPEAAEAGEDAPETSGAPANVASTKG